MTLYLENVVVYIKSTNNSVIPRKPLQHPPKHATREYQWILPRLLLASPQCAFKKFAVPFPNKKSNVRETRSGAALMIETVSAINELVHQGAGLSRRGSPFPGLSRNRRPRARRRLPGKASRGAATKVRCHTREPRYSITRDSQRNKQGGAAGEGQEKKQLKIM